MIELMIQTVDKTSNLQINPFEAMGFAMGGGPSSFTVGELLRLFCSSLKEQIKHRMYFYKTATLVR